MALIRRVVAAACLAVVTVISTAAILSAAPIASAPSAPTSYPLLAEVFRQATPPAYSFGDGVRGCTPDNNRTRVEVRSLSAAGRTRFTTAMRALIDSDVYQLFVAEYIAHLQAALGGAQFLPWHRLFLVELEGALRTIDPTVALPWWDWSLDAASPPTSQVWGTDLLGGATPGGCIPDGPFEGIESDLPNPHCVSRGFTSGEAGSMGAREPWPSTDELIALITESATFADFSADLELRQQLQRLAIGGDGGDMADAPSSPNDPAFYLHHAYLDRLWVSRQAFAGAAEYNGAHGGRNVSVDDELSPFGVSVATALALPCVLYVGGPGTPENVTLDGRAAWSPRAEAAATAAVAPLAVTARAETDVAEADAAQSVDTTEAYRAQGRTTGAAPRSAAVVGRL